MLAKVTLVLKGLIAVFVNPDRTLCTVGVLEDVPPEHNLRIIFKKPGVAEMEEHLRLEPPNIAYNLQLDVRNISQTAISMRNPTSINRQADPNAANGDSFSWIVDLENAELYNTAIGARRSAFSPILTFTNGDLFTHRVSRGALFTQRGLFSPMRRFGFVATEIGADFSLDRPESTAVFMNGTEPIDIPDPTQDWEIEVNNDANTHLDVVTDANHYYKAVGLQLSEAQRIMFMSKNLRGGPPAGPEAACFSTFLGQSQPQG
jgi:hypothetical protein